MKAEIGGAEKTIGLVAEAGEGTAKALDVTIEPTKETLVEIKSLRGPKGEDGVTPHIGENGNWWIGDTDTGIKAQGPAGANGTGSGTVTAVNDVQPDIYGKVTLGAADVGARPDTWTPTAAQVGARPDTWTPTAAQVGALPSGGTAANSDKLGGKAPEYYIQPHNLLDNADFTRFVAQAGIAVRHEVGKSYAGDRWVVGSGTVTATANSNGNGYNAVTLNGTIYQRIADAPEAATAAIGMVSGTAAISYADGVVTITSSGGVIKWAALYEGEYTADSLPPYVPKGYAAELAECHRYYKFMDAQSVLSGYITSSGKSFVCSVPFGDMRTAPSVIFKDLTVTIRTIDGYSLAASYETPTAPTNTIIFQSGIASHLQLVWDASLGTNNTPATAQVRSGSICLVADL